MILENSGFLQEVEHYHPESQVWVYQSSRNFTDEETEALEKAISAFTSSWQSHGAPVTAKGAVIENLWIVLCADKNAEAPSGCSIDSSMALIRQIETEFKVNLTDRWRLAHLNGSTISHTDRAGFQSLVDEGVISGDTIVFDNTVSSLSQLTDRWETSFQNSWHSRIFSLNSSSAFDLKLNN